MASFSVFVGPLAWGVDRLATYSYVPPAYEGGSRMDLHLLTLLATVLVAVAGAIAWQGVRRAQRDPNRMRFIAVASLTLSVFFSLLIAATAFAKFAQGGAM